MIYTISWRLIVKHLYSQSEVDVAPKWIECYLTHRKFFSCSNRKIGEKWATGGVSNLFIHIALVAVTCFDYNMSFITELPTTFINSRLNHVFNQLLENFEVFLLWPKLTHIMILTNSGHTSAAHGSNYHYCPPALSRSPLYTPYYETKCPHLPPISPWGSLNKCPTVGDANNCQIK